MISWFDSPVGRISEEKTVLVYIRVYVCMPLCAKTGYVSVVIYLYIIHIYIYIGYTWLSLLAPCSFDKTLVEFDMSCDPSIVIMAFYS
jgi:hypothetical protein